MATLKLGSTTAMSESSGAITYDAGTIGSAVNLNHNVKKDAWHLYRSTTVTYSSNAVLDFDGNKFIGSNVTESGGRITVGSAGIYWIGCAVSHQGAGVDTDNFSCRVNTVIVLGTTLYQSVTSNTGTNYQGESTSFVVELAANDIIDWYGNGYVYGGTGDPMTHFSGCRIGASS